MIIFLNGPPGVGKSYISSGLLNTYGVFPFVIADIAKPIILSKIHQGNIYPFILRDFYNPEYYERFNEGN